MMFQEPKVEFVRIDEIGTTLADSDPNGQEMHSCSGTSFQPEPDKCSADPSMF